MSQLEELEKRIYDLEARVRKLEAPQEREGKLIKKIRLKKSVEDLNERLAMETDLEMRVTYEMLLAKQEAKLKELENEV